MKSIPVYVETGKKRSMVVAVDWPGWCRSGRDEKSALQSMVDYGSRYAKVLQGKEIKFQAPAEIAELMVTERLKGNTTTDFGAPAIMLATDSEPMDRKELNRFIIILQASWQAFDGAVERAAGKMLRKGPRGGRNREKIIQHVLEADKAYLNKLAWKLKTINEKEMVERLGLTRQAILSALEAAHNNGLPEEGPRGGIIWSSRYFVRRVAYHVLDHAWEIENRIV